MSNPQTTMPRPAWLSKKRKEFSAQHNHICYWCGLACRIDVPVNHPMCATREHLVPKAIKKKGEAKQLVLAHNRCNALRATMDATGFKRLMQGEPMTKYDLWPQEYGVTNA